MSCGVTDARYLQFNKLASFLEPEKAIVEAFASCRRRAAYEHFVSPYLTSTKTVSLVLDAVGFDDPVTDIAKTSFFFSLKNIS